MQMQAFVDHSVMKTCKRVVLSLRSLMSRMMMRGDDNTCTEDEEFFQGRPDADDMEEAISKFLDGMEGQEHSGFKDLHRFLGRLPLPVAKEDRAMLH